MATNSRTRLASTIFAIILVFLLVAGAVLLVAFSNPLTLSRAITQPTFDLFAASRQLGGDVFAVPYERGAILQIQASETATSTIASFVSLIVTITPSYVGSTTPYFLDGNEKRFESTSFPVTSGTHTLSVDGERLTTLGWRCQIWHIETDMGQQIAHVTGATVTFAAFTGLRAELQLAAESCIQTTTTILPSTTATTTIQAAYSFYVGDLPGRIYFNVPTQAGINLNYFQTVATTYLPIMFELFWKPDIPIYVTIEPSVRAATYSNPTLFNPNKPSDIQVTLLLPDYALGIGRTPTNLEIIIHEFTHILQASVHSAANYPVWWPEATASAMVNIIIAKMRLKQLPLLAYWDKLSWESRFDVSPFFQDRMLGRTYYAFAEYYYQQILRGQTRNVDLGFGFGYVFASAWLQIWTAYPIIFQQLNTMMSQQPYSDRLSTEWLRSGVLSLLGTQHQQLDGLGLADWLDTLGITSPSRIGVNEVMFGVDVVDFHRSRSDPNSQESIFQLIILPAIGQTPATGTITYEIYDATTGMKLAHVYTDPIQVNSQLVLVQGNYPNVITVKAIFRGAGIEVSGTKTVLKGTQYEAAHQLTLVDSVGKITSLPLQVTVGSIQLSNQIVTIPVNFGVAPQIIVRLPALNYALTIESYLAPPMTKNILLRVP